MSPISNDLDVAVSAPTALPPVTPKTAVCAGLLIRVSGSLLRSSGIAIAFPIGPCRDNKRPIEIRLARSIADLQAAFEVFIRTLPIDPQSLIDRRTTKLKTFQRWGVSVVPLRSNPHVVQWQGLGQLTEETGELINQLSILCAPIPAANAEFNILSEVLQKIVGTISDVQAAMDYVIDANDFPPEFIEEQRDQSYSEYEEFVSHSPYLHSCSMERLTS